MHSISTSVFNGNVLTATHLLNISQQPIPVPLDRKHLRPRRLNLAPVLRIHGIHIRKVIHIIQEHVHLDDLVEGRASLFEDVREVLDALMLQCL